MRDKNIWLLWKMELRDGKLTKVPYQPNDKRASSTDNKTWSSFDTVQKHRDKFDGIGFAFDGSLLGVDLDHVLEPGKMTPEVAAFIEKARTYTEYSPSKTGLHLIFKLSEPLTLEANKHANADGTGFECYNRGRFFTFTQDKYNEHRVRTIDATEADELLRMLGYPWKKTQTLPNASKAAPTFSVDDERVLDGLRKNDAARKLFDGDVTAYNGDYSAADSALCFHLAFWTGKNAEQMERIWLASPLGQRKKTQDRADYRTRTIENAIATVTETYTPPEHRTAQVLGTTAPYTPPPVEGAIASPYHSDDPEFIDIKLRRAKSGKPYTDMSNALIVFQNHPRYAKTLRFNLFRSEIEFNGQPLAEGDILEAMHFMQTELEMVGITKNTVYEAMQRFAFINKYDEALDWFKAHPWDGTERLKDWLPRATGVENTQYHRAIGAQWLLGMVRRLIHPGSQFDHVLTIIGSQGVGKTSFFRIIGGDWYKSHTEGVDNKDFYLKLRGAALIDLDEGAIFLRSDSIKIKSIITETCDEYRAPYDRVTQKYPRRFVFSMSTNDVEPFKDQTGNRRYWLFRVDERINFEWLKENRDQLLAEAYYAIQNGIKHEEVPYEEALLMQESATQKDEWYNTIHQWLWEQPSYRRGDKEFSTTVMEVYEGALKGDAKYRLDRQTEMRIGNILRNDVKMIRRRSVADGDRQYRFYLTDKEAARLAALHAENGDSWKLPDDF